MLSWLQTLLEQWKRHKSCTIKINHYSVTCTTQQLSFVQANFFSVIVFIALLPISLSSLCPPQLGHLSGIALTRLPIKLLEWSFVLSSSVQVVPHLLCCIRVIWVWCLPSSLRLLIPTPVAWQLASDENNSKKTHIYCARCRSLGPTLVRQTHSLSLR